MRTSVAVGLASVFVLAGVGSYTATAFEKPDFGVIDIGDWENISDETFTVSSEIWIDNPNPIGLSLDFVDLKYSAEANEVTLASGKIDNVSIQQGNQTRSFETVVQQERIPEWWVSHLQNSEKTTVKVPVTVKTPITSFTVEAYSKDIETTIADRLEKNLDSIEGTYEGPGVERSISGISTEVRPELEVRDLEASIGSVSRNESEFLVDMNVHNPNAYPVPTPSFGGEARLNNISVANWRANAEPLTEMADSSVIAPGETEELRFTVGLQNQRMDDWLESHARREEFTEGSIDAYLIFNFGDQEFKLPAGGMNCQFSLQTAFLVDNKSQNFSNDGCEPKFGNYPTSDSGNEDGDSEDSVLENESSGGLDGIGSLEGLQ